MEMRVFFRRHFLLLIFVSCFVANVSSNPRRSSSPLFVPKLKRPGPQVERQRLPLPTDNSCTNICQSVDGAEPSVLKYRENEVYKYKFEGITSIHLPNSLKGESVKLNYLASFDLIAENKCSFILRISSVDVIGPDGKKYNDRSLLGQPARFSWSNGKLEKFCIDSQDSITASNLKRSIITNLQISSWGNPLSKSSSADMSSSYETDIYGRCPVTIETSQEQDGTWTITKNKDLNQCKYRQGFDFAVSSSTYISDSPFQTNPFVQANLKSVTRVEKGVVKSVEVNEEYNYQPLTNYGDSQTSVIVSSKINLLGKSKNGITITSLNQSPSSLLFETEKNQNTGTNVPTIIKAIQEASALDESGVLPAGAAKSFSQFVSILQQAKRTDILTTYAQVKSGAGFQNKEIAKSVFWDGLITAGTPAATETAATLLINNEMPEDKISQFLMCLSFVKHPTDETLLIVSALLDGPNADVDRYLALGSLIKKYVMDHKEVTPALENALAKITLPLARGTAKTMEDEDRVIASLKGLRNAQYLTPNVSKAVRDLIGNKDATIRARVAALQTLMVNSSDEQNRKLASNIMTSKEEDAEMRINAFLAYVNEPAPESAEVIKNLLDNEESDQVGSYITSYLKNLRTSTKPEKEILKQYYGDIRTNKKFPYDFRQYSQNYQFSQLFSALNLGYSAEADVIFSSQSYVPRSSSFGLNSYLFGNAFNLFEVDTRIENLEYFIEKYAGPRSYMRSTEGEDIADDLVDQVQSFAGEMAQKVVGMSRSKRATTREPTIKQAKRTRTPLSEKYIDFDLSFKMFDSEVKWLNMHTDKDAVASDSFTNTLHKQIEEAIKAAKNIDVDYKRFARSPILSNNVIYYPTSTGFPIKLSTDVNSVVNLKMNGSVDVPQIINRPKSAVVQLKVMPSAVLQADGMLEIDAYVISAGLKASSSVRTATGLDISFSVLDGQGFDIQLGLPVKDQDIFTLNSEAFTTVKERGAPTAELELKPAGKRYNYGGTFDQLADLTGMSLWAEVSSPAFSYKPTMGPGRLSLRLLKEDEALKYYQIRGLYDTKKNDYRSIELTFDTPGSSINRKVSIFADCNTAEHKVNAHFISPMKKLTFEGKGIYSDKEVAYSLKFNNDLAEYNADLGATITQEKNKTIYKPYLKLKTPNDGREKSMSKVRGTARPQTQLLTIDGQIILETKRNMPKYRKYDMKDLSVTSPIGKLSVNGPIYIDTTNPLFGSDIVISYGEPRNTISIKGNFNYTKNTDIEQQIDADLAIMPSEWPDYGFKYTMYTRSTPHSIERDLSFTHGPDLDSKISKIRYKQTLNIIQNQKNGDISSMSGELIASYPLWKFDLNAGFQETGHNYFVGNSVLVMDRTHLELNGSLGIGNRKVGNVDVQLQSKLNEKSLTINAVRELVDVDKSNVVINLNAKPGKQIVISADLTHALKPMYYVLRSESTITVSPNKIYKHDVGVKYTPDEKSAHLLVTPNNERSIELKALYATPHPAIHAKGVTYIKDIIDGVANFEKENDKAIGDLNINIIKTNRLITGKLDLNVVNDSNYQGYLELLWDANKDASKKLKIDTNTSVMNDGRSLKTENSVDFNKYGFQLNGNYSIDGELLNGSVSGGLDLVVPKGPRIGFQFDRLRNTRNTFTNYDLNAKGYYYKAKSNVPVTADFLFKGRNIDLSRIMFDAYTELGINMTKTKTMKIGLSAKNKMVKNIWSIGGMVMVDGSLIKNKTNLQFDTSFSNLVYNYGLLSKQPSVPPTTYHLIGNYGDNYLIDLDGKVDKSEWSNTLLMRIPVNNQPFDVKYHGVTVLDITSSKNLLINTTNALMWENQKFLNWEALFEVQPNFGKMDLAWETTGVSSRTLKMGYSYGMEQTEGLLGPFVLFSTNLTYDNKLANCLMKYEYSKDLTARQLIVSGESPSSGQFYLQAINKLTDNNQKLTNELSLQTANGKWAAVSLISMYPTKPAINLSYTSPEGVSKFILNGEEKVKNYWTADADISWVHGGEGYFKADTEMKLDSIDDILIKMNIDAPIIELSNFSLVASNKASTDIKKKIKFDAKMSNIPLVSGSLSYIYQSDNSKLQFEAEGSVKFQNKLRPITFKYNRIVFTKESSGENGNTNKLYFSLDNKKYELDLEATFTDKRFLLKRDLRYGGQSYKMDLSYNVKTTDSVSYEEDILAHIDLKPFFKDGEEFTFEGKTTRSLSNYNNRMLLQWAPDKSIEYTMYSTAGKSGISFTLPKRQIAAETTYLYKVDGLQGDLQVTTKVWFDKKRDESKHLMVSFGNEYRVPEDKTDFIMKSSALFRIPTLPKTISVTNELELSPFDVRTVDTKTVFDIFRTPEQAVTVTYQVHKQRKDGGFSVSDQLRLSSVGQELDVLMNRSAALYLDHLEAHAGIDYMDYKNNRKVSSLDFELRINSVSGQLQIMNISLIKGKAELGFGSNYIEIKEDWNIINHAYGKLMRLTTEPNIIAFVEWKGDVKQKVLANASFAFRQYFNVDALLLEKTAKKIASFNLSLDEVNFMKSKSEINIDNLRTVLENGQRDLISLIDDAKKASKAISTDFNIQMALRVTQYRNAAIDFKPAIEATNSYLAAIRDEIKNDPSIVNATENVKKLVSSVADSVIVFLQQVSAFLGDWVYGYNMILNKIAEFFEKLVPEMDALYQKSVDDFSAWLKDLVNQYSKMMNDIVEYIRANKDNWREILLSASETFKDSFKTAYETYEQLRADVVDFIEKTRQYLSSLPITGYLKDKLIQLKNSQVPKYVWSVVSEAGQSLKDSVSSPEFKNLIDNVLSTADKILNDKPYDIKEEVKNIGISLAQSIRALITAIQNSNYIKDLTDGETGWPKLSLSSFKNVPNVWSVSTSFVNWIRDPDFAPLEDTFMTYRVGLTGPSSLIPPFKRTATIIDGQQIVTFSGNYYSINGESQYLLAGDFADYNFTVMADIKNGALSGLAISSNSQSIEIYPDKRPNLDRAPTDYPINGDGMYAIRTPRSIDVYVDNSLSISCLTNFEICTFEVSGFYQNKVYGLLGTVNSENMLDFTMPDLNVSRDIPRFVKSYDLGKGSYPPIPAAPGEIPRTEECTDLFNGNSVLSRGFSFVNSQPYRNLCDYVVNRKKTPEEKLAAACKMATAYSLVSYVNGYYLSLPSTCAMCSIGGTSIPYGYSASLVAPQKQADIVVILEKTKYNEPIYNELLTKSMPLIQKALAAKGITDVNFGLIGYGPDSEYPSIHTTNGKIGFDLNTNVKFSNTPPKQPRSTLGKTVKNIKYFLGDYDSRKALQIANDYPYRNEAVKVIIHIKADIDDLSLDRYNIFSSIVNAIVSWNVISGKVPIFMITTLPQIDSNTDISDVFGFDTRNVYTAEGPKPMVNYLELFRMNKAAVILPLTSDGAVFNGSVFVDQTNKRDQLTNVFANTVSTALTTYQRTYDCYCKYKYGIYSEPQCSITQTAPL